MPYNTSAIPPRKEPTGQTQLPLSRVKKIISQDPEVQMCSNNAAFVITLAAEMFIQHLTDEALTQSKLERKPRRNIQYKDVANAISHHDHLEFLEDVAPKTVPFKKAKAASDAAKARLRGEQIAPDKPSSSKSKPKSKSQGAAAAKRMTNGNNSAGANGKANGNGKAAVNGEANSSNPFSLAVRGDDRQDDPNEQLELEMRQAAAPHRDGDVDMTG